MSGIRMREVLTGRQRSRLLVAIISGGRPSLQERPTSKYVEGLQAAGFTVVWVVSEADAPGYERDSCEVVTYPVGWAYEYAKEHWMRVEPPELGGFHGAFVGREAACREAERRGCWGVLQLDDNIQELVLYRGGSASREMLDRSGWLALFADVLGGISLSTNARTVGAQMTAVISKQTNYLARPGFPYSLFVERVGEGREEWYGPYEDDITHSFQYGDRADGATAALVPLIQYLKESKSKSGMRAKYDHTRSVQLQRLIPQGADIKVMATKANGRGAPRVFHKMKAGAIRNPLRVHDQEMYRRVQSRLEGYALEWLELERAANRLKLVKRLGRQE